MNGWTSPCSAYYDCKTYFSKNHQGTLEKQQQQQGLLVHRTGRNTAGHGQGHTGRLAREGERERAHRPEGVKGGVPRLSQIHTSLVKLKRESGVKRQKGNSRLSHGQVPRANSAFAKGDFLDEAAWLFIELCSW